MASLRSLSNASGNVIILSLIATLVVVSVAMVAVQVGETSDRQLHIARVKNLMTYIEYRARSAAIEPVAYQSCNSSSAVGTASCQIRASHPLWTNIAFMRVSGSRCVQNALSCGIELRNLSFNGATRTMSARVVYTGTEFNFKPIDISVVVPVEVLQSQQFLCDSTTPIFRGFDSQGRPICNALPSCSGMGAGRFIKGINPSTMSPICDSVCGPQSCTVNQFISSFRWTGAGNCSSSCSNRLDPYVVFGEP